MEKRLNIMKNLTDKGKKKNLDSEAKKYASE
jgi:hypothetical protein